MKIDIKAALIPIVTVVSLSSPVSVAQTPSTAAAPVNPTAMPRVGTVDERFQSYNIEMVEVTGGRFWKPYAAKEEVKAPATPSSSNQPAGISPDLFRYRPPIDLSNQRLRKLATALSPAYVRVSGTWANTTYFQDSDAPAPATPPAGFNGVLTRAEWKGVVDFSHAANAQIVTSFPVSLGTRGPDGVWTPKTSKPWVEYTKAIGGKIVAAEYMNEPNLAQIGGTAANYDAAAYAKDVAAFRAYAQDALPGLIFLGPGGSGEGTAMLPASLKTIPSADLLAATGPAFDAFSYHAYGTVSSRCSSFRPGAGTTPEAALSEEWLSRTETIESFYANLRDRFVPGKPIWLTETAQAACGGDRWASTYLDTFRYLNQLGVLARRGVKVHMHNTLASSDYGLLDENTYEPRPNYWAALVWRKLMGTTVLDPGPSPSPSLRLYAHCLRSRPGGVALLAINVSREASQSLGVPIASERYTLTAANLEDKTVELNGVRLELGSGDTLPALKGSWTPSGLVTLAPASSTFLALPSAHNASCQ